MKRSKLKRVTLNVSMPAELREAINKVPRWEFSTASAYIVSLIVRDLKDRKLLPPP